jgi:hypothetical protein
MQVYNSFQEMAAGTEALTQNVQSQMAVFNTVPGTQHSVLNMLWRTIDTEVDGKDVLEGHNFSIDFRLESYAGDYRKPNLKAIATQEEKDAKYLPLTKGKAAFYGVITDGRKFPAAFRGKTLQFSPHMDKVTVVDTGQGEPLPHGWENAADVILDNTDIRDFRSQDLKDLPEWLTGMPGRVLNDEG